MAAAARAAGATGAGCDGVAAGRIAVHRDCMQTVAALMRQGDLRFFGGPDDDVMLAVAGALDKLCKLD